MAQIVMAVLTSMRDVLGIGKEEMVFIVQAIISGLKDAYGLTTANMAEVAMALIAGFKRRLQFNYHRPSRSGSGDDSWS